MKGTRQVNPEPGEVIPLMPIAPRNQPLPRNPTGPTLFILTRQWGGRWHVWLRLPLGFLPLHDHLFLAFAHLLVPHRLTRRLTAPEEESGTQQHARAENATEKSHVNHPFKVKNVVTPH